MRGPESLPSGAQGPVGNEWPSSGSSGHLSAVSQERAGHAGGASLRVKGWESSEGPVLGPSWGDGTGTRVYVDCKERRLFFFSLSSKRNPQSIFTPMTAFGHLKGPGRGQGGIHFPAFIAKGTEPQTAAVIWVIGGGNPKQGHEEKPFWKPPATHR